MPDKEQPGGGKDVGATPARASAEVEGTPVVVVTPAESAMWVRAPDPSEASKPAGKVRPGAGAGAGAPTCPTCPTCGGPLVRYAGSNPHKHSTGRCEGCGVRHHLSDADRERTGT